MTELVSTKWLQRNLNNRNLVIFDCSWFLSSENKNPSNDYKKLHIEGSHFFDIDKISDQKTKLPHTVPKLKDFKLGIKRFNIHDGSIIITYGSENILGASRVWWMFKYFGFNNIKILNGGLSQWIKEKRPTTNKKSIKKNSTYDFFINKIWIADKDIVFKSINNKKKLILDARNNQRFNGIEKEPRKGLRSGHIPNSKNIFWKDLTNKGNKIITKNLIKEKFKKYNIKNNHVILSCGSGISACVLSLSLKHGLDINGSVYDGSWTEWGSDKKLPIKK